MNNLISVGQLRHRIDLVRRMQTPNDTGSITYTNVVIASRWADVRPRKGSRYLNKQQTDDATTHEVVIRYENFVDSEMFIIERRGTFSSNRSQANDALEKIKTFRVLDVMNLEQRDIYLILSCQEYFET